MSHILFLSTNRTICQSPRQLGYDFIVVDHNEGPTCKACSALLMAHNARSRQYDILLDLPASHTPSEPVSKPFRGLAVGLLASTIFWLSVALILWTVIA